MNNLLVYLYETLSNVHTNTHLEIAKDDAPYPYIVFNLPTSTDAERQRQDFILEVDIWDQTTDTRALETLTDDIDKTIKKVRYVDDNQLLIFTRINRLMISDPDPMIRRRQLRYEIKRYEVES
ncbi:hypothetical protein HXA31_20425 [Salipaludibacillus agaradhaerens]|uniref:DUF3168 domain-containing protein n=1 Tax=Salipaludibacillus agaradhaerens TaxID=76935 RepID=A0A9Q4B205_SALAG|nr:hypothetical protein [Salipaludibacillus agaradhaerens]MCR6096854.1 hypothetical protein [Salipaludibacillus agaradhaerens]MCR6116698.1 hypothetical protein [Salipaludibacillus agaradhaerens]